MEKLRVFTTFTGIGSPEMALRNIKWEYEVVGISEVDKYALLAYDAIFNNQDEKVKLLNKEDMLEEIKNKHIAYNFSTNKSEIPKKMEELQKLYTAHRRSKNYGDIRLINEKLLPDFDLFTYSFPCKNISIAGQQAGLKEGSGTQSSLLWECERIIKEKQPKYLLMENVKNLVGKKHINEFNMWIETLNKLGYNSYWKVLNGKDFNVPQNRERVIMISILKEYNKKIFNMPKGRNSSCRIVDILEDKVNDSFNISKDKWCHINNLDKFTINNSKRELILVGNLDNKTHSNTCIYHEIGIAPTLNSMNGGNRQPKVVTRIGTIIDDTMGYTAKDCGLKQNRIYTEHSPSLRAMRSGLKVLDSNYNIRKLTPLECWRLMGYCDDDFYKAKNIGGLPQTKLYERAGRGIVVTMLEDVFKALQECQM